MLGVGVLGVGSGVVFGCSVVGLGVWVGWSGGSVLCVELCVVLFVGWLGGLSGGWVVGVNNISQFFVNFFVDLCVFRFQFQLFFVSGFDCSVFECFFTFHAGRTCLMFVVVSHRMKPVDG